MAQKGVAPKAGLPGQNQVAQAVPKPGEIDNVC